MNRAGLGVDDRLRLKATRMVTRDLSPWTDDDADIELVVEDVLAQWQDGEADEEPCELTRFWNRYADRVELAEPGPMDTNDYYRAVWRTHVAGLHNTGRVTG